jgi:hypothetical protein
VQCGIVPTQSIINGSYWQSEQRSIDFAPIRQALIEHIEVHNYVALCMSHLATIPLCYCVINFGDKANPAYTDVYNMEIVSVTDMTTVISTEKTPFCEKGGDVKRYFGVRIVYQGKSGVRWTYTDEGEMAIKLQMMADAMKADAECQDDNTQIMIKTGTKSGRLSLKALSDK